MAKVFLTTVKTDVNAKGIIEGTITTLDDPTITKVRNGCFSNVGSLISVNLINCTDLGSNAFSNCVNLVSVNLPSATNVGNSSFYNCTNLETANVPNVYSLGQAFYGCVKLTSVSVDNVSYFSSQAFYGCSLLPLVDTSNLISISNGVFADCSALKTLILRKNAICTLSYTSSFNNTPIATSQTEGFIYVPDDLEAYNITSEITNGNFVDTSNWNVVNCSFSVANNKATITTNDITSDCNFYQGGLALPKNHKFFINAKFKIISATNTPKKCYLHCSGAQFEVFQLSPTTGTTYTLTGVVSPTSNDVSWLGFGISKNNSSDVVVCELESVFVCDLMGTELENAPAGAINDALTQTQIDTLLNGGSINILGVSLVNSYKSATNWSTFASKIKGLSELGE